MLFTTIIALAAVSSASGAAVRRFTPPSGWWTDGLEPYDNYHTRYLALDCEDKHNTTFFTQCCHPLRKEQSLSDRPDICDPANNDDDCTDDEPDAPSAAPAPASTPKPADTTPPADPVNVAPAPAPAPVDPSPAPAPPPAPKPSPPPAPKPSPPPAPKPSPKPSPAPSPPSSGGGQTGNGFGTFFFQNGVAGACGTVHGDNTKVVALDINLYGNQCNGQSPLCGKTVTITNTKNGKSVDAIVADCCPTCVSTGSIDMSVGAFTEIATEEEGEVPIDWVLHN